MSETPDIIGMLQNSPYAYEQRRLNFAIDGSKKKVFSTSDDKINFLVLLGPVQGSARLHGDEPFFWGEGLSDDSKIKKFLEIKNSSLELIYETPQKIEKMNEKIINGLKFVDGEEIEYTKKSNEILKENPTYISFCTVLLIGLLNAWEQYEKSNKQKVLDLIRDNIFYILKNAYPLVYGFKKFLPGDTFIIHIQTKNDNYLTHYPSGQASGEIDINYKKLFATINKIVINWSGDAEKGRKVEIINLKNISKKLMESEKTKNPSHIFLCNSYF